MSKLVDYSHQLVTLIIFIQLNHDLVMVPRDALQLDFNLHGTAW